MLRVVPNLELSNILEKNSDIIRNVVEYRKGEKHNTEIGVKVYWDHAAAKLGVEDGVVKTMDLYKDNLSKDFLGDLSNNLRVVIADLFNLNIEGKDFTFYAVTRYSLDLDLGILLSSQDYTPKTVSVSNEGYFAFHKNGNEITLLKLEYGDLQLPRWVSYNGPDDKITPVRSLVPRVSFLDNQYSSPTDFGKLLVRFDGDTITESFIDRGDNAFLLGSDNDLGIIDRLGLPHEHYYFHNGAFKSISSADRGYLPSLIDNLIGDSTYYNNNYTSLKEKLYPLMNEAAKPTDTFVMSERTYHDRFCNFAKSEIFPGYYELRSYSYNKDTEKHVNIYTLYFNDNDYFTSTNFASNIKRYLMLSNTRYPFQLPLLLGVELLEELVDQGIITQKQLKESKTSSVKIFFNLFGGVLKDITNSPLDYFLDNFVVPAFGSNEDELIDPALTDEEWLHQTAINRTIKQSSGFQAFNGIGFTGSYIKDVKTFPECVGYTKEQIEVLSDLTMFLYGHIQKALLLVYGSDVRDVPIEEFTAYVKELDTFALLLKEVRYSRVEEPSIRKLRIDNTLRTVVEKARTSEELKEIVLKYIPQLNNMNYEVEY